jgi:hypothetical protein
MGKVPFENVKGSSRHPRPSPDEKQNFENLNNFLSLLVIYIHLGHDMEIIGATLFREAS